MVLTASTSRFLRLVSMSHISMATQWIGSRWMVVKGNRCWYTFLFVVFVWKAHLSAVSISALPRTRSRSTTRSRRPRGRRALHRRGLWSQQVLALVLDCQREGHHPSTPDIITVLWVHPIFSLVHFRWRWSIYLVDDPTRKPLLTFISSPNARPWTRLWRSARTPLTSTRPLSFSRATRWPSGVSGGKKEIQEGHDL